jgi:predicted histone-like DNA-binding protein
VYQNQNEHSSAYGKWYGRVKYLESLNTRKLATHISEHGSIYTPDVVYGVLEKFRSCLLEMLLNSKKVKIEGLGTFYTTLECKKGGALTKDKFNINSNIDGLHIRFLPEQEQEQNISSRQFLKQAEFINVDSLLKKEDENGGGSGSGSGSGSQNSGSENSGDSGNSGNSGSQAETVAAPTISGETPFDESTQVTISGPDGAEIRYTVDGSAPTAESQLYSEAFTLTDTVLVKAIAIKNGVSSEIASKTFTKNGSGDDDGFDIGS